GMSHVIRLMKCEILNHPTDLKIRVFGKTLPEVFANAAIAVAKQQLNDTKILRNYDIEEITVESPDLESLLVDWLSEILYRGEVDKKIYTDFKIMEFLEKPYKIKAKIKGAPFKAKNIDIKAVTYHDLEIKKAGQTWQAIVIFDI
ncbi:archease, partial [Candidatus Shapirobacteria bacterium]|nr:archease [Candidatus Shapirobacteria bacterium]